MYYNNITLYIGVQVHPPDTEAFQMTVHVVGCTCDLPARAMVQNFIQFNGQYGCCYCKQPGTTVPTEKGGHVHTFPYVHQSPKGPPRTQQAFIQDARKAVKTHSVVCTCAGCFQMCIYSSMFCINCSYTILSCLL